VGRNLFLRSIANRIVAVRTNPGETSAGIIVREFDVDNGGTSVSRPFAEVDYKTSGGHDSYNAMQISVVRRSNRGLTMNAQYTLGRSFGNSAGSNEAITVGNNARNLDDFDYDNGYNTFDVRHNFNTSLVYNIPTGSLSGIGKDNPWQLGSWEALPMRAADYRSTFLLPGRYRLHRRSRNVFTSPDVGRTPSSIRRSAVRRELHGGRIWYQELIHTSTRTGRFLTLPPLHTQAWNVRQSTAKLPAWAKVPSDRPDPEQEVPVRGEPERGVSYGSLQHIQSYEFCRPPGLLTSGVGTAPDNSNPESRCHSLGALLSER
jgi:hypothetical protein